MTRAELEKLCELVTDAESTVSVSKSDLRKLLSRSETGGFYLVGWIGFFLGFSLAAAMTRFFGAH